MTPLPPQLIIPIFAAQMERTALGKLSRINSSREAGHQEKKPDDYSGLLLQI